MKAIRGYEHDIRGSARCVVFHRVAPWTRSGAEGYRFEPYRAYHFQQQLTELPLGDGWRVVPLWYRSANPSVLARLSDVALAKICRKRDVPLPGRGYWPRKA